MEDTLKLGLDIDKKLIESHITAAVSAAIAESLGDPAELVEAAVRKVLTSYVDEKGEKCSQSSWRATPWIEWIAKQTVEKAVKEQMEKAIEENKEVFMEDLKKELSKPQNRKMIATNFVTAMLDAAQSTWKMPVTVNFEKYEGKY